MRPMPPVMCFVALAGENLGSPECLQLIRWCQKRSPRGSNFIHIYSSVVVNISCRPLSLVTLDFGSEEHCGRYPVLVIGEGCSDVFLPGKSSSPSPLLSPLAFWVLRYGGRASEEGSISTEADISLTGPFSMTS